MRLVCRYNLSKQKKDYDRKKVEQEDQEIQQYSPSSHEPSSKP